ncbi:MAG: acetyl-CoA C-acyltransferase [Chloroflexi bacterium]|nr:acetyl-CoA C-acyltransferase [Chloroflexota bacterium]MBJ7360407.1 acetyl-CoA C-acyltransferase [Chloroflexota bacterium]
MSSSAPLSQSSTPGRPLKEAWIVEALRTPFGRYGGALAGVRPDDLAATVLEALVARSGINAADIDDVILGCANQAGEDNRNVARMALLVAGYPVEVPGQTVNRLCGSGLQALAAAANAIAVGDAEVVVAGGVESMSRAPLVTLKPESGLERGNRELVDTTIGWRFVNPRLHAKYPAISLGETAERVADQWHVSREAQDELALASQQRAAAAAASGIFAEEIVPVSIPQRSGAPIVVDRDEHPRPDSSAAALAKLKPAFTADGTVTAGNASGINDGAAALLVVESERARALGLKPYARIVATAVAGVDPSVMGAGPIPAIRKLLERTGLTVADIDRVELNEAFASQAVACITELGLDPAKTNVHGGAIALGHPLGASGARMATTLVRELRRSGGRYGIAAMCVGVGQGIAMLVERVEA